MGQLTMAFENEYSNDRTIDHESGAYLVYEGGTPERCLHRFSFHWKGEKMDFYAQERDNEPGDHSWNPHLHWNFFQVKIPDHMQDQQEEIITMIRQALETHGFGYSHRGYDTVTAEYYSPKI